MKRFFIYFITTFILVEFIGCGLALAEVEPSGFKLYFNSTWSNDKNAYADIDSTVGVWHQPNDTWVKSGPCFTVTMQSNQFGATDNIWDTSQKGYLFLGNSFIEGYGVAYGERISEAFEQLSKKEVFNCGMSGTFSLVQSYKTLDKFKNVLKFDTCFVFLSLPNDEGLITELNSKRVRPFLTDTGIAYTKSSALFPEHKTTKDKAKLFISQFSYSYHLYDFFNERNHLKSAILQKEKEEVQQPNDFTNTKRVINLFTTSYPDKYFYFVILPTLSSNNEPLVMATQQNMNIIDLRSSIKKREDYLICNPHWNSAGHQKVAAALYSQYQKGI